MADTRKKLVALTTPRAALKFPALVTPEFGSKEFPKPDGEYKANIVLDAGSPEAAALIRQLQPHFDAAVADGREAYAALSAQTRAKLEKQGGFKINEFYTELLDKETEEPTGEIEFKIACPASGEYKKGPKAGQRWKRRPALFDAKGNPIIVADKKGDALPNAIQVWGGSIARVNFEISPYFISGTAIAGIKLALVGVQIIELVSGGQRSAKSMGFGEEEGGYEADNSRPEEDADETSEGGASAPGETDDF